MNEHEGLIEEAAKAMVALDPGENWEDCDREWYLRDARAAFAVFENARTPTDDERGALIVEWANVHQGPNAQAVLLEMLPIGDQMSLALRDALRELETLRADRGGAQ